MGSGQEARRTSRSQLQNPVPAHDEIAGRAYLYYLERGSIDGHDVEDWLAAERELARERVEPQPSRRPRLSKTAAA